MTLTPRARRLALTAHVTVSVGWLGAAGAYLALAIAGLTSADPTLARAVYPAMALVGWTVIVPLAFATLATGLVLSLGTEWGLLRHYWVLAKFLLTCFATTVLVVHLPNATRMASHATTAALASGDFREVRTALVTHPAAGLLVLFTATVLSIHKPWGRTPHGQRVRDRA